MTDPSGCQGDSVLSDIASVQDSRKGIMSKTLTIFSCMQEKISVSLELLPKLIYLFICFSTSKPNNSLQRNCIFSAEVKSNPSKPRHILE